MREDDTECDAARGRRGARRRMPGRQREYYKDEAATASTWTDGRLAAQRRPRRTSTRTGSSTSSGRKKDLIIRGGNNIYPTDVEAVLLEHPDVQEAAVIGVPHAVLGEDVAAFVVVRARPRRSTSTRCSRSAPSGSPTTSARARSHFVDELPRNATGKVMKHLLSRSRRA